MSSGLQNTGVAIFFLRLSLPQPDSDLAIVVPIFVSTSHLPIFIGEYLLSSQVAIAIPIPLLIIYAVISAHRRYRKRHGENPLVTNVDAEHDRADYEQLPTSDPEE